MFINNFTKIDSNNVFKIIMKKKALPALNHRFLCFNIYCVLSILLIIFNCLVLNGADNDKWQLLEIQITLTAIFLLILYIILFKTIKKKFIASLPIGSTILFIDKPLDLNKALQNYNTDDTHLIKLVNNLKKDSKELQINCWLKNPDQPKYKTIIDTEKYFILIGPSSSAKERFLYEKYKITVIQKNLNNSKIVGSAIELRTLLYQDMIII